jgi:hypothetical protein
MAASESLFTKRCRPKPRAALRRLGAVQMTTAATVGNLVTTALALAALVHGGPLFGWHEFLRVFLGWGT